MPTNINDATYFELRLVEELCLAFDIEFRFEEDLALAKARTQASHGANSAGKIATQERRLVDAVKVVQQRIKAITENSKVNLTDVNWVGGSGRGKRVADVDCWFEKQRLPISVKSGGPGTERNLGAKTIKSLIGFDAMPMIDEMKLQTVAMLKQWFPTLSPRTSWTSIREKFRDHEEESVIRGLAARIGNEYQTKISDGIIEAFTVASSTSKADFVRFLALQNSSEDEGMEILVARDADSILKSLNHDVLTGEFSLSSNTNSDKGSLILYVNEKPYWRINVNFTNGRGLSSLAVRAFLI